MVKIVVYVALKSGQQVDRPPQLWLTLQEARGHPEGCAVRRDRRDRRDRWNQSSTRIKGTCTMVLLHS